MKINKWFKNIIYLFLIVILFYGGTTIISNIIKGAQMTYEINFNFITLTYFIFFGGIGIVLGLDNFIKELKKEGKLRLDISRIMIFGLPCLIFSIPKLQYILPPTTLQFVDSIYLVSSIILGYTLICSLVKEEVIE